MKEAALVKLGNLDNLLLMFLFYLFIFLWINWLQYKQENFLLAGYVFLLWEISIHIRRLHLIKF